MGETDIIHFLSASIFGLAGFLFQRLWSAVSDLRDADDRLTDKVQELEVIVAGRYVTRDEMMKMHADLLLRLDKITSRIDEHMKRAGSVTNYNVERK